MEVDVRVEAPELDSSAIVGPCRGVRRIKSTQVDLLPAIPDVGLPAAGPPVEGDAPVLRAPRPWPPPALLPGGGR
uniref:Uncharacterized protein n=1 Tax=Arundo donax TaxID=35708 RepID=A0A0A9HJV8_ARUDO